jgi:hypothetical protein
MNRPGCSKNIINEDFGGILLMIARIILIGLRINVIISNFVSPLLEINEYSRVKPQGIKIRALTMI